MAPVYTFENSKELLKEFFIDKNKSKEATYSLTVLFHTCHWPRIMEEATIENGYYRLLWIKYLKSDPEKYLFACTNMTSFDRFTKWFYDVRNLHIIQKDLLKYLGKDLTGFVNEYLLGKNESKEKKKFPWHDFEIVFKAYQKFLSRTEKSLCIIL